MSKIMKLIIGSIDIGAVNFSFFIDEVETDNLTDENIFHGTRIRSSVKNISDETDNKSRWSEISRKNLVKHLNENKSDFEKCGVICIEQQFFNNFNKFGIESNIAAIKISECVITWFECSLPEIKTIFIQPKLKYVFWDVKNDPEDKKKWSSEFFEKKMIERKDEEIIKFYKLKKETFNKRIKSWKEEKIDEMKKIFNKDDKDIYPLVERHLKGDQQKMDDIADSFLLSRVYLKYHVINKIIH